MILITFQVNPTVLYPNHFGDSDEPDNESVDEIPRRLDGTPAIAAWKALMGGIDEPQRDILGRKRKIGRESNKGNGRIKKSPRSKERLTP